MTTEHYYTPKPKSKLEKKEIIATIKGIQIPLTTATGIFAKEKIDLGTKILIENVQIKEGAKVLDLGCGYGIVGIAVAKLFPQTKVVMTDVNERATKLAMQNAKLNKVEIDVRTGNGYETVAKETFDCILLNPPQTAGRDICLQMIEQSIKHLNKNGVFYLVARHKKGGQVLEAKMKQTFGNVETITRESGFRVYRSVNQIQ